MTYVEKITIAAERSVSKPRALTLRQREALLLAANGKQNAAIATQLGITTHSVTEVLSAAYRRLGAENGKQAVAIALAVGELGVHDIHIPDQQRKVAEWRST